MSSVEAGKNFEACERIMGNRPQWLVLWGSVTRLYWAFPRFDTPEWLWPVFAADPQTLISRMDEVEQAFGHELKRKDGGGSDDRT